MRTFEDFPSGMAQTLGPLTVSKDDIVAFAREYDAQPFHVDEIAARDSFIGTLIASGWHSCSLNMRLVADGLLLDSSAMGAPGIEERSKTQTNDQEDRPVLPEHGPRREQARERRPARAPPLI